MKKYIYVLDKEIALMLKDDGLKPLSTMSNGNDTIWVFENNGDLKFSKDDAQKVYFSNTLRMYFV